MKIKNLIG